MARRPAVFARPHRVAGIVASLSSICAIAATGLSAQRPPPGPPPDAQTALDLPTAVLNDLTEATGRMVGDTLVVALDLVDAAWTPRGADGPRVPVAAFAEAGGPPMVPGPLIRASAGTLVRITFTNRLDRETSVRSPIESDGALSGAIRLEPGTSETRAFVAAGPASSVYEAVPSGVFGMHGASIGAIVVDPPGGPVHPDERILLMTAWGSPDEPGSLSARASWKLSINGRSWPFTERLEYAVGDTVHWRVINSSPIRHPMHLHGFFYDVTSIGDLTRDSVFAPGSRAPVVTQNMINRSAMTLTWVPTEPGNWIFHCHLVRHMGSATQRFVTEGDRVSAEDLDVPMDGMAGLITGITIRPGPGSYRLDDRPARRIDLYASTAPGGYGDEPRLAFIEQRGAEAPSADSLQAPSSTLVLHRDEPTAIVVHNRLASPLGVHWHGLELLSTHDGVGNWSGMPAGRRAPIATGDTAWVHLEPPRAGTFMYHTHGEKGHELAQGLYGILLVLEPGASWDPMRDRVYLLGAGGASRDAPPAINGLLEPPPERLESGGTYRLRFGQIAADESKIVRLLKDGEPVEWLPVAKDGADLVDAQRIRGEAVIRAEVGETFDFEWIPADGVYQLEVTTVAYPTDGTRGATQTIALGVGDVSDAALEAAHGGYVAVQGR